VTAAGCDTITAWEAVLISTVWAPIRLAIISSAAVPTALSCPATMHQDAVECQAGGPDGLGAGYPLRKPGIVLDPCTRSRLTTGRHSLEHERAESFRDGVDRRGQPGRAGTDDQDVVLLTPRRGGSPKPAATSARQREVS
jgi:hypothetical protein